MESEKETVTTDQATGPSLEERQFVISRSGIFKHSQVFDEIRCQAYVVQMNKECLTHNSDTYKIHIARMKGSTQLSDEVSISRISNPSPQEARYLERMRRLQDQRMHIRHSSESTERNYRNIGRNSPFEKSCYAASIRNNRNTTKYNEAIGTKVVSEKNEQIEETCPDTKVASENIEQIKETCSNTEVIPMDLGTDDEELDRQESTETIQALQLPNRDNDNNNDKYRLAKNDNNTTATKETETDKYKSLTPKFDNCHKNTKSDSKETDTKENKSKKSKPDNSRVKRTSYILPTSDETKVSSSKNEFQELATSFLQNFTSKTMISDSTEPETIPMRDPRLHKNDQNKEIHGEQENSNLCRAASETKPLLSNGQTIDNKLVDKRTNHIAYNILKTQPIELKIPEFLNDWKKSLMKSNNSGDRHIRNSNRIKIRNRSSVCRRNINKLRRFYKKPVTELMKFCCHVDIHRNECSYLTPEKSLDINITLIDTKKSFLLENDSRKEDTQIKEQIKARRGDEVKCCNRRNNINEKIGKNATSSVGSLLYTEESYHSTKDSERINSQADDQEQANRKDNVKSCADTRRSNPSQENTKKVKLSNKEQKQKSSRDEMNSYKRTHQTEQKKSKDTTPSDDTDGHKKAVKRRKSISTYEKGRYLIPYCKDVSNHEKLSSVGTKREILKQIKIAQRNQETLKSSKERAVSRSSLDKHNNYYKDNRTPKNLNKFFKLEMNFSRHQKSYQDSKAATQNSGKIGIDRGIALKRHIMDSPISSKRMKIDTESVKSSSNETVQAGNASISDTSEMKAPESYTKYQSNTSTSVKKSSLTNISSSLVSEKCMKLKITVNCHNLVNHTSTSVCSTSQECEAEHAEEIANISVTCNNDNENVSTGSEEEMLSDELTKAVDPKTPSDCGSNNRAPSVEVTSNDDDTEYSLNIPEGSKSNSSSDSDIASDELLRTLEETIEAMHFPSKASPLMDVKKNSHENDNPLTIEEKGHSSVESTANSASSDEKSPESSDKLDETTLIEKNESENEDIGLNPARNNINERGRRMPQLSTIAARTTVNRGKSNIRPQSATGTECALKAFKIVNAYIMSKCRGRYLGSCLEYLCRVHSLESELRNLMDTITKMRDIFAKNLLDCMRGLPKNIRNRFIFVSFFMDFLVRGITNDKVKPFLSTYIWELVSVHSMEYEETSTLKYFKTYIENDVKAHQNRSGNAMTIQQNMILKSQIHHYLQSLVTPVSQCSYSNCVEKSSNSQNTRRYMTSQGYCIEMEKCDPPQSSVSASNKGNTKAPISSTFSNNILQHQQHNRTIEQDVNTRALLQQELPGTITGHQKISVGIPCTTSSLQQHHPTSSSNESPRHPPTTKSNNTRTGHSPKTFPEANPSVMCPHVNCCTPEQYRSSVNIMHTNYLPTSIPITSCRVNAKSSPNQRIGDELIRNIVSSETGVSVTSSKVTPNSYSYSIPPRTVVPISSTIILNGFQNENNGELNKGLSPLATGIPTQTHKIVPNTARNENISKDLLEAPRNGNWLSESGVPIPSSRITSETPQSQTNMFEATRTEREFGGDVISASPPRELCSYPTPPRSNENAASENKEDILRSYPANEWNSMNEGTTSIPSPNIGHSEMKPLVASPSTKCLLFDPERSMHPKDEPVDIIDLTWLEDDEVKLEPSHDGSSLTLEEAEESLLILHNRKCLCGEETIYICACNTVMYCSQQCQFNDWENHERNCLQE